MLGDKFVQNNIYSLETFLFHEIREEKKCQMENEFKVQRKFEWSEIVVQRRKFGVKYLPTMKQRTLTSVTLMKVSSL